MEDKIEFTITPEKIKSEQISFIYDEDALSGVLKIADKVINDIKLIFDIDPTKKIYNANSLPSFPIIFGTMDKSPLIDLLDENKIISLSDLRDKNESYIFNVVKSPLENVDTAIIIIGSDKRGTIYGLFHLSEILGVSPFVDWLDVLPKKLESFTFNNTHNLTSKPPSIKYRGFFINDEWPAFGNWTMKNFGGFNAKMYSHVFELLLRLHGNYLWPAMWSSRFSSDGPGLESAVLADELGVVMGMSHHEPCLRHGEDYKYFRGKDSVYGDAWNFITNKDGITKFWEDGLIRCGKFENVITVGMRGEADSAIMGDATLEDNINLLKSVLETQNMLIKKFVDRDLMKVPRMLALYKEVEPYFYGDETTKGLMGSPLLEGVTLMLCDDNFGNLRTLPTEEMKGHNGGYGMYYHFDYHGAPTSFEWVNSSYLPKIWEQMTQAYEFEVRELWIVNIGDMFTNEFPLAYFLSLAYDYEKWGISNFQSPIEFTKKFINENILDISDENKNEIFEIINGNTKIAHNRRPEAMNSDIYDPENFNETDELLEKINLLISKTNNLNEILKDKNSNFPFYELIYYPVMANLNLQKMQLLTSKNHYYALCRSNLANILSKEINNCIKFDQNLVDELHTIKNGKWYGMGLSEHVGFSRWNEEECQYPIICNFKPANKGRIIVSIPGTHQFTEGGDWTKRELLLYEFLNPEKNTAKVDLLNASIQSVKYEIVNNFNNIISLSKNNGTVKDEKETIILTLNREKLNTYLEDNNENELKNITIKDDHIELIIQITTTICHANIRILISRNDEKALPLYIRKSQYGNYNENTFIYCGLLSENKLREVDCTIKRYENSITYDPLSYISIEANHYIVKKSTENAEFKILENYGKTFCGLKVFPVNLWFSDDDEKPSLEYNIVLKEEGTYEILCYIAPSNPVDMQQIIDYEIKINDEDSQKISAINKDFKVVDGNVYWEKGVLDNIRISKSEAEFKVGLNKIFIMPVTPGFVLEKIVIVKKGENLPNSYLGPKETFYIKKEI